MEKYKIALLALALTLCAGCGKKEPEAAMFATAAVHPEKTVFVSNLSMENVSAPEITMGKAKADKTPAILDFLMRGETVDVVGEYDEDYYVIKTEKGYGLVGKELLRDASARAYKSWRGYSYYRAEVYDNYHLAGEPVEYLIQNAQIDVLDDLGYCYVVQVGKLKGFMNKTRLSQWYISSGDSAGAGGNNSSDAGGGVDESLGADGGDISLQFYGNQAGISRLTMIDQTGDVTGQAVVLADKTEVTLGFFDRDEEIPMVTGTNTENQDGYVTVYLNGLYACVPQMLVMTEDMEAFEAWDGYSRWNGAVYDNFYLLGEPAVRLYTNAHVHVIDELETCYLVEVDGKEGYLGKNLICHGRIATDSSNTGSNSGNEGKWSLPIL